MRTKGVRGPISEFTREATPLEEIKQVLPLDGVKGLANIKLEEDGWSLPRVKASSKIANIQKVVMDGSCFDEGALGVGDELGHVRAKPQGEHLRNDLRNCVDEASGSIVGDPLRPFLLRQ